MNQVSSCYPAVYVTDFHQLLFSCFVELVRKNNNKKTKLELVV